MLLKFYTFVRGVVESLNPFQCGLMSLYLLSRLHWLKM